MLAAAVVSETGSARAQPGRRSAEEADPVWPFLYADAICSGLSPLTTVWIFGAYYHRYTGEQNVRDYVRISR